MEVMEVMEARPAEDVEAFAERMLARAFETGKPVLGEFNQHTFQAVKGMTVTEIMAPYSAAGWRSYFGDDRLAQKYNN